LFIGTAYFYLFSGSGQLLHVLLYKGNRLGITNFFQKLVPIYIFDWKLRRKSGFPAIEVLACQTSITDALKTSMTSTFLHLCEPSESTVDTTTRPRGTPTHNLDNTTPVQCPVNVLQPGNPLATSGRCATARVPGLKGGAAAAGF